MLNLRGANGKETISTPVRRYVSCYGEVCVCSADQGLQVACQGKMDYISYVYDDHGLHCSL